MSTWWPRLKALTRRLAAGAKTDRTLDDEIQAYLREDIEARIRTGENSAEARRAALAELGGIEQVKERVRDARTGAWLDALLQDVRYGVRTLVKTPGYSLSVIGSLSLGMASVIAAVAFANGITLRPFPGVRDQRDLVEVKIEQCVFDHAARIGCVPIDTRPDEYLALRETTSALQGIAASTAAPVAAALPGARALSAVLVTPNFFDVLGTTAAIGRTFAPEEGSLARAGVVVIAHSLWVREFEADPAVLGRAIRVADNDVVIIGVAPEGFAGIDLRVGRSGPDVWLPLALVNHVGRPSTTSDDPPSDERYIRYVGRLAEGSSLEQVRAQAEVVAQSVAARRGESQPLRVAVSPVRMYPGFKVAPLVALVLLVSTIVLVIACVNAANLLLARGSARQHEIAIRLAIGASRRRIIRQLLTESLLLAGAAALVAVPLVWWTVAFAVRYLTIPMPLDLTVLAVTVVIAGVTAVGCGLSPAFRVTAYAPAATFSPAQAAGASRAQTRVRRAILVGQMALALVLLSGGVQLVTALKGLDRSAGTPPDRLLIASFDLGQLNFRESEAEAFYGALLDRVSRLPGVQAAGLAPTRAVWTFRQGSGRDNSVVVWRPTDRPRDGTVPLGGYAGGNLIEALGLGLLQGRTFTDDDRRTRTPQVAVVNRPFADRLLEGHALGMTLSVGLRNQPYTSATLVRVVGVIEAAQEPSYNRNPPYAVPTIYLPVPLEPAYALALYVREHESAAVAPRIRDAVRQIDSRVPILQLESLAQANERLLGAENTLARATGVFGAIALLLATWGLYGVVSYIVTLRSREIAVRLALGARPKTMLRMVLSQAMTTAALGATLGSAAAIAIGRVIQSEVHAPGGLNPAAIAWPAAVLIAVMLAASAIPAARAGRVNLLQLLKEN
jgi:predicted permease